MKAGARKSLGEYKPVIIHPNGRSEVVGKRGHTEHWIALTNSGETWRPRRGVTFPTRDEAVSYAQRHIERLEEARARTLLEMEMRQERYRRDAERLKGQDSKMEAPDQNSSPEP